MTVGTTENYQISVVWLDEKIIVSFNDGRTS